MSNNELWEWSTKLSLSKDVSVNIKDEGTAGPEGRSNPGIGRFLSLLLLTIVHGFFNPLDCYKWECLYHVKYCWKLGSCAVLRFKVLSWGIGRFDFRRTPLCRPPTGIRGVLCSWEEWTQITPCLGGHRECVLLIQSPCGEIMSWWWMSHQGELVFLPEVRRAVQCRDSNSGRTGTPLCHLLDFRMTSFSESVMRHMCLF